MLKFGPFFSYNYNDLSDVCVRMAIGALRCTGKFPGETVSEETSTGVNEFGGVEKRDVAVEDKNSISEAEAESESESSDQTQALEFLNDIKVCFRFFVLYYLMECYAYEFLLCNH